MKLAGKVAVITGGTGGIGLATARKFVDEGATVVLADLHRDSLAEAAARLGERADHAVVDVTQAEQIERLMETVVARHGGLDILVANAGIEGAVAEIVDYPVEQFDQVMAINVRGVWLSIKYAVPALRARGGGSIVITSSIAGVKGVPRMSAYSASKHAVVGIMRSVAIECARDNIRVNAVNPRPVDTRMMRSIEEGYASADAKRRIVDASLMQRYARPDEVASMIAFLASDEASYCNGGVYPIDGGNAA